MADHNRRNRVGFAAAVAAGALLAGCSHLSAMRWPWSHRPPPPPVAVDELLISSESGVAATYPQYWKRNTLLVDLHEAAQEGGVVLQPRAGAQWPVRLAFRVTPGSIGVLEVRGEQRLILPVAAQGAAVDLELVPGVYTATTTQIKVHWSPH
ncbi:MAG TPA: hypothetical protein VK820_05015 [Steroidobacteraceae bacterium]|jgi:hypothetical protein|nr:hypothetical protein [Steroidobacteraceae bacterium]